MKLTIQQRGYMTERLFALAKKRIEAEVLAALGAKPELPPKLTFADKCALIRANKAKLKPQEQLASYTDLINAYDYPAQPARVKAEKAIEAYDAKAEKIGFKILQEKQRVVDMLMLGESADALAALEAFEKAAS
jgi:hypothetical protein